VFPIRVAVTHQQAAVRVVGGAIADEHAQHTAGYSDAISRESEISEGCLDATDPAQAIASANRILDLAKSQNAYVIYGHGPEQWKELKKAPDLYN
jgi:hypothetical protein